MYMKKGFWSFIYERFRETYGAIASVIGLVISVITLVFVPDEWKVGARWLVLIIMIFLYLLWLLIDSVVIALSLANRSLPKVRYARSAPDFSPNSVSLMLLDPSDLYTMGSIVSIYRQDEYEELMGFGEVLNVQEDGRIQILVGRSMVSLDRWSGIVSNNAAELSKIRVKAFVPNSAMYLFEPPANPPEA
jgi:hypothetical protein